MMETLNKLWLVADREAKKIKSTHHVFDPIGLILIRPLENMGYESTPVNSLTFAHTGGDGVHFSLVSLEGKVSDTSPVVMTVPANYGSENLIVGENLVEFLCLGERVGYFCLEQLTYNDNKLKTIGWIEHPETYIEELYAKDLSELIHQQEQLLGILRKTFGLKSWRKVKNRLDELQNNYMSMLEFRSTLA
jgi:hypothetical protein